MLTGNIIDLCGLSGSGKTLLCRAIAVNLAINYDFGTIFIDTNGDFSADGIYKMLINRKITSETQRKHIMKQIKVTKCCDPNELIRCIETLTNGFNDHGKFKLLVIDSMPAIWFNVYGMNTSYAQNTLVTLIHRLRRLAVEHAIIIIAVNIVTRSNSYGK